MFYFVLYKAVNDERGSSPGRVSFRLEEVGNVLLVPVGDSVNWGQKPL